MHRTFESREKWQRYYIVVKSAQNHRSLTLRDNLEVSSD